MPGLPTEWRRYALLAALFLLALGLRITRPGIAELKGDEIRPLTLANQIWLDHELPVTCGNSSTGLPTTPFVGYLLVLPRMLSADPRAGVVFLGLLDSVAVLATYLLVRRLAGERLALISAALYAANPWATVLSRKTWAEIVPLFTVLALWAASEVVIARRPKWAVAFFPLLALQVQSHIIGALLLPAALLTVLLFWPRWKTRYALLGALLAAAILAPYILVLAGQRGAIRSALAQNVAHGPIVDLRAISYGLQFASGATITALLGPSVAVLSAWERALRVVEVITGALMAAGLAWSVWALFRRRMLEVVALLLIWLVTPLVPLVFMRGAMGTHYLLLLVPALFVLVAVAWERIVASWRPLAIVGGLALAGTLVVQAGAVVAVQGAAARCPTGGAFGRTLDQWLTVREGLRQRLSAEGLRDVQVLGVDDEAWSSERAILDYLLRGVVLPCYVGQGGRAGLLVPQKGDCLALVLAADGRLADTLARHGSEVQRWELPGDELGVRLYRVREGNPLEGSPGLIGAGPGHFENGMRLLGMRPLTPAVPGKDLVLESYWAYMGQGANPANMAFNHLLDGSGKRWGQEDGFALSRPMWRTGYTLVQWYTISLPADLPAGDYWLFTGMYSLSDMSRANLVDDNGAWLGDGARMGPIPVKSGR